MRPDPSPPTALRRRALLPPLVLAGLLLWAAAPALAQPLGTVAGTVVDGQTGETLIGVNVVVAGTELGAVGATQVGAATDLDGRYQFRVAPGTYAVVYSYVGYDAQTVEGVEVRAGQTTTIDVALNSSALGLGEVVVQADAILSNEAGLLRVQARAPAILDGISAQQIRRAPDATSGEALRRVTGVTISGGKFAFVRGLPERYSGTLLNGSPVASTEPDRRAFAYDLIPANLLDNVTVAKSATPDMPGDFAGGMLTLNTVDFPEAFTAGLSLSSSVSNATGSALLIGPRGGTDYLGIDDGTRSLPGGFPATNLGDRAAFSDADRAQAGRMLNNGWGLTQRDGPLMPNFAASAGGSAEGRLGRLGAVGAVTYRSGYGLTDVQRREFEGPGELRFDYAGTQSVYNVTWGGIANVSYRPSPFHSLSLKNFYTRTADDEVSRLAGAQFSDQNDEQQRTLLRFLARDVYSGQLIGEHAFQRVGASGLQVRWDLSHSFTTRDEPDYRSIIYRRGLGAEPETPFRAVVGSTIGPNTGGRFFSTMEEGTWSGSLRGALPLGALRLSAGAAGASTSRAFDSRFFAVTLPVNLQLRRDFDGGLLTLPLDRIFQPENFGRLAKPGCESGGRGCEGFVLSESDAGGSDYEAGQGVAAGFVMADAPLSFLSSRLRFVGGLRYERAVQTLTSTDFDGGGVDVRSPYADLLPSVNLTYGLSEQTNVRVAYSRNVNRPELRELAPFNYYDFELQTGISGNPELRQATIDNLDLRVETYPGAGQLFSASAFFKYFDAPIERSIVPGVALNAERTFTNALEAYNVGFELEGRYGLGALSPYLRESSALVNYTWVTSEVTVEGTAQNLARLGRPLQGQAPYVINAGLNLVEPTRRTAVSVLYNRLGSRIAEVATALEDDIVERPRDLLDLSVTQPLMNRYELRFTVRDLLNQPQRFVQGDDLIRENRRGTSIGFGLSARF